MDSKKIANKVMARLSSTTKTAETLTFSTSVELEYFQSILVENLLDTLKKEWNLSEIDIKELDWNWKNSTLKWGLTTQASSGKFSVYLTVPDQEINIQGEVTYTDDKDKDHEYDFDIEYKIEEVEAEYDDVKLRDDIHPQTLTKDGKKLIVSFGV